MSKKAIMNLNVAENHPYGILKYGNLNIRRSVNGTPATLQQLASEHLIQNDIAMQAIAAAIGRANNTMQ